MLKRKDGDDSAVARKRRCVASDSEEADAAPASPSVVRSPSAEANGAAPGAGAAAVVEVDPPVTVPCGSPKLGSTLTNSAVPHNCRNNVPVMLGIDEAGRGPVLGPMVYGAAYWPITENDEISALGFDDSKALSAARRAGLLDRLKKCGRIGWVAHSIHPAELSATMLRSTPVSLNTTSWASAVGMIKAALADGVNVQEVFVDTVGNPERYQAYLTREFKNKIVFTVAKKADSLFKVVSAASIVAKVTRDAEIEGWTFPEVGFVAQGAMGSGYPGDAITKKWLVQNREDVFGFPNLVRFSWQTTETILTTDCTPVDWGEDEEKGTPAITGFFSAASKPEKDRGRAPFFRLAGLQRVTQL